MNIEDKKLLIEEYIAAYNAFDIDGMLALLSSNIVFSNQAGDEVNATASGIKEFRILAEKGKSLFSSRKQQITKLVDEGEFISIDVSYHAVVAVDLPNGLKPGETLSLNGRTEFSFDNGKISLIKDII